MIIKKGTNPKKIQLIIILTTLTIGILISEEINNTITGLFTKNINVNELLTEGLVLYLNFEEGTGNQIVSQLGNITGDVYGAKFSKGFYNQALSFNGENSFVIINSNEINTVNQSNTVSYWVYIYEQLNEFGTGSIYSVSTYSHLHSINNDCWFIVYRWNDATNYRYQIPNCKKRWIHIAETYETEKKISRLFVNGELVKTIVGGNTTGDNNIIYLSKIQDGTNRFFNGIIDEFKIYNRSLSSNEIEFLYKKMNEYNFINTTTVPIKINEIEIELSEDNYKKLKDYRDKAYYYGLIIEDFKQELPADITFNNETFKAMIRLKGDCLDHIETEKWSFRIDIQDNKTIYGMKTFSIQAPERRAINEWIYYKLLKDEELISIRYIFVNVSLNNKFLGEYVTEEVFSKELLENNNRLEGPIITFSEEIIWLYNNWWNGDYFISDNYWTKAYLISDIEVFKLKSTLKNEIKYEQFMKAKTLWNLFRKRQLKTSQVFDIKQLAKITAINDLMGAVHVEQIDDRKYYYNPITSLIEPIGFDADAGQVLINELSGFSTKNIGEVISPLFTEDLNFTEQYIKELKRITNKEYIENFIKTIPNNIKYNEAVLHYNQRIIQEKLNPEKAIQTYLEEYKDNKLILKIGNIQELPIEIISISKNGVTISINQNESNILFGLEKNSLVNYQEYQFIVPSGFDDSYKNLEKLRVHYKIIGLNKIMNDTIYPYSESKNISEELKIKEANFEEFDFIYENNNTLIILPGEHIVNKTIVLPKNHILKIYPGTKLDLKNNATIISYSPVNFQGTKEEPIIIMSSDGTGQGLTILQAENESIIDNAVFYNLSEPRQGTWHLTGAVTFYESPVKISNTRFLSANSEDALNIVRTSFTINNSIFMNSKSDCFDADYTTGTISDTEFKNCGGDALDTSGSIVSINNVKINKTGDKGISIGEASIANIKNVEISNTYLGIASKDSSVVTGSATFENVTYDLTAYQKKEEYGPSNITFTGTGNYLCEENSNIIINGEEVTNKTASVFDLLYTENNVRRI